MPTPIDRDGTATTLENPELAERTQRIGILSTRVQQLFPGEDPQTIELRKQIEESFRVPQYGPYHNEGMFMDSHLELILQTLEKLKRGEFPEEIPASIRSTLQSVAIQFSDVLERYTFLHDISKKDCLTVKYNNGPSKEFTWEEWQAQFTDETKNDPVALRAFCEAQGIKTISYYHSGEGGQHGITGRKALESLGYTGVPAPVLTAIEKHEVAYQFTGINPDTYKKHLGGLSPEERDLALTASYLDTSASLTQNKRPDYSNFVALVHSRHNFEIITAAETALTKDMNLDQQKVAKAFADLRKSKERLADSAEDIIRGLEKRCKPTQYDPDKLREKLAPLIAASTITEAEADEIAASVLAGRASDIGKRFGKKMKEIGPVLKASEKISGEELAEMNVEALRGIVDKEGPRIAKLGTWPPYIDAKESLSSRVPKEGEEGPGFDAGLASALDLIPRAKQRLSAMLHAAYTPDAIAQVRKEIEESDPDSETTWWLAACSLCEEGKIDVAKFKEQLCKFDELKDNPEKKADAARKEFEAMTSTFETDTFGVPYGTKDGCMQGAYLAGHPFATMYGSDYGIYFIGTPSESLGLEDFAWSDEKDAQDRPKSGPVWGSKQFVKCANEDEFRRAIAIVQKKFAAAPKSAVNL